MPDLDGDRDLIEETWRTYDEEFAEYVGDVVTPYEYVDTEEQVDWVARIFMFGYGLGSIAGAQAAAPDAFDRETNGERVDAIVDHVVAVHESEEFDVSNERVKEDFLQ